MKVCILSASPNKDGLTNSCVEVAKIALKNKNNDVTIKVLNHYNLKRCEACGKKGWGICREEHKCKMNDDFNSLKDELELYDSYIIVSPVYFWEMSEVAKTFFDRLKRCESLFKESRIKNKKVMFIACAGGSGNGTDNTLNSMDILSHFMNWEVISKIGVGIKNFEDKKQLIVDNVEKL